jgi:hypothetical protein
MIGQLERAKPRLDEELKQLELPKALEPYVEAMLGATGISEWQAQTCVLYALLTWHLDELEYIPALVWLGATGTGKSRGIDQMLFMVKDPKPISSRTYATLRDELNRCGTALIDEGDKISEAVLRNRTDKRQSTITHKRQHHFGFSDEQANVFGATIIARRDPIRAEDLRNRAIIIRTEDDGLEDKDRHYNVTATKDLEEIAKMTHINNADLEEASGRVMDTWKPLLTLGASIGLQDWVNGTNQEIEREVRSFRSKQGYESRLAVVAALDKLTWDDVSEQRVSPASIRLNEVSKFIAEEFAVRLKPSQVEEVVSGIGLEVGLTHGYKVIKPSMPLLEEEFKKLG